MKTYVLRRKRDGYIIQYSERYKIQVDDMMKSGNFEFLSEIDTVAPHERATKTVPIIEDTLECPICGFVAKDDGELVGHKETHYGKRKKL